MTATPTAASRDSDATEARIRWDVVERRCHEIGADTDEARAEHLGLHRRTMLRWRHGQTGVRLATALHVAKRLGVRLDQLVEGLG